MANHPNRTLANLGRRMANWSDAKLDKEIVFARLANDSSAECEAWVQACEAELRRREAVSATA